MFSSNCIVLKVCICRGVTRGSKGGTIPWAPNYNGGGESLGKVAKSLQVCRKVQNMSQVLSSVQ